MNQFELFNDSPVTQVFHADTGFDIQPYSDEELVTVHESLAFDIECYSNYFLAVFKGVESGKVVYFEYQGSGAELNKLRWLLQNKSLISFNGIKYDIPMLSLVLHGFSNDELCNVSQKIVENTATANQIFNSHGIPHIKADHIDLIEVAPLFGSLKTYAARIHVPRLQELPFPPSTKLDRKQMDVVKLYCINDVDNTISLYKKLEKELSLRKHLGDVYNVDLRSKSDAQIAETIITSTFIARNGSIPPASKISPGTGYHYAAPSYLKYDSTQLRTLFEIVKTDQFKINDKGRIDLPESLSDFGEIEIGDTRYAVGIGGLHSVEKLVSHKATDEIVLIDYDVTSYYPQIILNLGLYPERLGKEYLNIYSGIVSRRIQAKRDGLKVTADALKIAVNGAFGKLASPYSVLYSPNIFIHVTLTGQLALLMLIERLENHGISVVSANTDGVIVKCQRKQENDANEIVRKWETDTNLKIESANYNAIYSRDVNNYIAVGSNGYVKLKGCYSPPSLTKNPHNEIVSKALVNLFAKDIAIEETIGDNEDIRDFLTVRRVNKGAVKNGQYLGSVIRWYHSTSAYGDIVYAANGNKVPYTEQSQPCIDLPETFPDDIDYAWYVNETRKHLISFGVE